MHIQYKSSFERDVKKASLDAQLNLKNVIAILRAAQNLNEIPNLKKLKGHKTAYRIRITDYRLGLYYENGELFLSRFLPRKSIYRVFP